MVYLPYQQLHICLVDVFVKRPKPCDLIPYPLYLSLSPTNKYLNSKKEKKSDPTRPVAIYTPFYRKEKRNKQHQKKRQVDAGISVPLRYKQNEVANCSENYLARDRAAASACLLLPFPVAPLSFFIFYYLQEVWYGMVWCLFVNCSNFIHLFIYPPSSFVSPWARHPEMLSLLVETGSEATGCDIKSPFCKTRQNATRLATRHIT